MKRKSYSWRTHTPYQTPVVTRVPCHSGNVKVFENEKLVIYGGGVNRGAQPELVDISINLTGKTEIEPIEITLNEKAKKLLGDIEKFQPEVAEIIIDWPDMGVIPAPRIWWEMLIERIERAATKTQKRLRVLIHCIGGHGRTGTALAIIGCLLSLIPENECPVEFIRKIYCQNAIETYSQIDYIERITGRVIKDRTLTKTCYTIY